MEQARTLMLSNLAPTPMAKGKQRQRITRLAFRLLEAGMAFVFLGAVVHHVLTLDFKPLAALCLPILAVFFAFASLLFIRGRALTVRKAQIRSLYAAERAMQAAIWQLFGIILGTSLYGILKYSGITDQPSEASAAGLWLLLFLAPYSLMQIGLLCFMRAVWTISPAFLRRVGAFELRRRVRQ